MSTSLSGSGAMTGSGGRGSGRRGSRWRRIGWSAAAVVLLAPLVAMQVTDEVRWGAADFALAAALVLGVGIPLELTVRATRDGAYRAGMGVALGAAFLLVWANAAVGILGSESYDANGMYDGVVAVGLVGAALARFRARGMAWAMLAVAIALVAIAGVALGAGLGAPVTGPREIVGTHAFFVALFGGAALLFGKAARTAEG